MAQRRYAADTSVSTEASRSEIERTLRRYGASGFLYGWDHSAAMVQFEMRGKRIRFVLPMPDRHSREFTHTEGRGQLRSQPAAEAAWEQACRSRWRALGLAIKAKLEAVEVGISELESEFLGNIVLPNDQTVAEVMVPEVEKAYLGAPFRPMLPAAREEKKS